MTKPEAMTEDTYRALDAVNFTAVWKPLATKTPYHALHALTHGSESTPSRDYLTAGHCLTLTPDMFGADYWVLPDGMDRRALAAAVELDAWQPEISDLPNAIPATAAGRDAVAWIWAHGAGTVHLDDSRRDKAWKAKVAQFAYREHTAKEATHEAAKIKLDHILTARKVGNRTIITAAEYDKASATATVVRAHPDFAKIRNTCENHPEVSVVADVPGVGLGKGRIDWLALDHTTKTAYVIDYKEWKTTKAAQVQNDITRNAWDVQPAWYELLARLAGLIPADYATVRVSLVAAQGNADDPLTAGWFPHSAAMVETADARLDKAIATYAECKASGVWPGQYPSTELVPPKWAVLEAGLDPDDVLYAEPKVTITPMPELDT